MKTATMSRLWTAMDDALSAARTASKFRGNGQNASGIMGEAGISHGADGPQFDICRREADLSNHEELKLRGLIGEVETALERVLAALEDLFPGHLLSYSVVVLEDKHRLAIDGLPVLDAVRSTWKSGHLKILRDVYGSSGRGRSWLMEMHFLRGNPLYGTDCIVFAPTLAEAAARWRLCDTTLTDRKKRNIRDVQIYAAAAILPGEDDAPVTPPRVDARETRRILSALSAALVEIDQGLPISIDVSLGSAADGTPLTRSEEITPLLHAEDIRAAQDGGAQVEAAVKAAVAGLEALAPNADFVLKAEFSVTFHRVTATVGTKVKADGGDLAQALEKMEGAAGRKARPYLIPGTSRSEVVIARGPGEALERAVFKGAGPASDPVPMSPVRHAEVRAASAEANAILARAFGL